MENFLHALSLYIKGYHAMILSGIEGDLTKLVMIYIPVFMTD